LVAVQAVSGLFASDDIITEGPLAKFVTSDYVYLATDIHKANANLLLAMIALHVAAVVYYLIVRSEDLIRPMITGAKQISSVDAVGVEPVRERSPIVAIIAIAAAAGVAYYIFTI